MSKKIPKYNNKKDTSKVYKSLSKLKRYSGRAKKELRDDTINKILFAIRESGELVNQRNIKKWQSIINKERKGKTIIGEPPKIAGVLFDLVEYWRLNEITKQSIVLPKTITISSKMIFANKNKTYKGGEVIPDFMYQDFIKYCNDKRTELEIRDDSDDLWYVGFTKPYYDNILRSYVIEIVSTDRNGKITDYGYRGRSVEPKSDVVAGADIGITDKKVEKTDNEIDKQINLEKEKSKRIEAETELEKTKIKKIQEINNLIQNLKSLGYTNEQIAEIVNKNI